MTRMENRTLDTIALSIASEPEGWKIRATQLAFAEALPGKWAAEAIYHAPEPGLPHFDFVIRTYGATEQEAVAACREELDHALALRP